MSIIKCPECGKEISSETKICLNCGYKIKKKRKKIKSINKKKLILGNVFFGVIIVISVILFFSTSILNENEKIIYNAVSKIQPKFKVPSSIEVSEVKLCGNEYAILNIGGENSFGAINTETYYLHDNNLYQLSDSKHETIEIVEACFKLEKNNSDELVILSNKSVNKINKKLQGRYK